MISFKTIRWKNILSTGNVFTEVRLDKSPNTLIVGENGAGKSTILDALCFVLYGKPFRKIKKDQLVNSINLKDLVVEVEFSSYNRNYKIVRGIKPNLFEIYQEGSLINQSAAVKDYQEILERNILRMNLKSFTQIVILGSSSFVPFMQLPAGTRREVIEDLLDIRIFSTMGALLKTKASSTKVDFLLNDRDIAATKELMKIHKENNDRMNRDNEKLIEDANSKINALLLNIKETEKQVEEETAEVKILLERVADELSQKKKKNDIENVETNLNTKLKNSKKNITFYEENDHCPTCTQAIDTAIKAEKIEEKKKIVESVEDAIGKLKENKKKVTERLNEIAKTQTAIQEKQTNIASNLQSKIKSDKTEIKVLRSNILDLQSISNNTENETAIKELEDKLSALNDKKKELSNAKELYEVASTILKDTGIKARIVKQYIPVINALVNKYLAAMDFFVKFELDENFNEKILSRHRDEFTYDSFSEGEKMRIDLALLFTWRTVARMKNSASTNLLILDEVFDASLDNNGCEEFLKLIHSLENANIFVISHKGDVLQDKFRSSIRFEKHHNFSRIMK